MDTNSLSDDSSAWTTTTADSTALSTDGSEDSNDGPGHEMSRDEVVEISNLGLIDDNDGGEEEEGDNGMSSISHFARWARAFEEHLEERRMLQAALDHNANTNFELVDYEFDSRLVSSPMQ